MFQILAAASDLTPVDLLTVVREWAPLILGLGAIVGALYLAKGKIDDHSEALKDHELRLKLLEDGRIEFARLMTLNETEAKDLTEIKGHVVALAQRIDKTNETMGHIQSSVSFLQGQAVAHPQKD